MRNGPVCRLFIGHLFLKNKNEKLYDIPGGGIELGETIEEAIHREAMEEAGVTIKLGKLQHIQQGFFKHVNGNFYQTLQLFYLSEQVGELREPTEGTTEFVAFIPILNLNEYPLPKSVLNVIDTLNAN